MPSRVFNVLAASSTYVGDWAASGTPLARSFGIAWRNEVISGDRFPPWATGAPLEAKRCQALQAKAQDTGLIWSARLNGPLSIGMCILPSHYRRQEFKVGNSRTEPSCTSIGHGREVLGWIRRHIQQTKNCVVGCWSSVKPGLCKRDRYGLYQSKYQYGCLCANPNLAVMNVKQNAVMTASVSWLGPDGEFNR